MYTFTYIRQILVELKKNNSDKKLRTKIKRREQITSTFHEYTSIKNHLSHLDIFLR